MRVKCQSFDEFLVCLSSLELGDTLFSSAVRFSQIDQKSGPVSFEVSINLSAVVRGSDGSEYLVVTSESCGIDYRDSGGDKSGSNQAAEKRAKLIEFCSLKNWKVLPGTIET